MDTAARKQEIFEAALDTIRRGLPEALDRAGGPQGLGMAAVSGWGSGFTGKTPGAGYAPVWLPTMPTTEGGPGFGRPLLYGANGKVLGPMPLPDSYYSYKRAASKREGSMKTWFPHASSGRSPSSSSARRYTSAPSTWPTTTPRPQAFLTALPSPS